MKVLNVVFACMIITAMLLTACAPAAPTAAPQPPAPAEPTALPPQPTAEPPKPTEPPPPAPTEAPAPTEVPAPTEPPAPESIWDQDYISQVPPIMMIEPYFDIFGQSKVAVPYYYEEAVKLSGHSCGAVSGAWTIAKKALDELYPGDEIPVRGQIKVEAPGAADEWFVGVFGEVIMFVTGAAPETGFIGSEFGKANDLFVRQDKMHYPDEPTGTLPPKMEWIFTRTDTGRKVGVNYNLSIITPIATEERTAMGVKLAKGEATPEEAADYAEYWNARAKFVFENQDMDGFFNVKVYEEGAAEVPASVVSHVTLGDPANFAWDQPYIMDVAPIMMKEPYFDIFGQTKEPVPYYYYEAVKLAGHSCGAVTGAWTITKKALEALYPDGEVPVRGMIKVDAPGAANEWFVGVFGDVITFITGAAPDSGFIGSEFGKANDVFVRQYKMIYPEAPTGTLPPKMEWIFTRLDTGRQVGVNFNLSIITPLPTEARTAQGIKMATGTATEEERLDYYKYWNARATYVFENEGMDGFFNVKIYNEGN